MKIWVEKKALWLHCSINDSGIAKSIAGDGWRKRQQAWKYPLDLSTFKVLCAKFPKADVPRGTSQLFQVAKDVFNKAESIKAGAITNPEEEYRDILSLPLFDHQLKSFTFYKNFDRVLDFSEPGAGKTAVQLALIKHRMVEEGISKILVVCPLAIVERVWAKDIEQFMPNFPYQVFALNDTVPKAKTALNLAANGVYVINYEKTWRIEDWLLDVPWDFIIFDESGRLASHNSKQTKTCIQVGQRAKYVSLMSGTPGSWLQLFSQMRIVDEMLLGNSYWAYVSKYFDKVGFEGYTIVPKQGATKTLKRLVDVFAMAWKKADCLDLPPLTTRVLSCKMEKEQARIYREMAEHMVAELNEEMYDANLALTKLLRLNQITSGFIQETGGENVQIFEKNPKLELLKEVLSEIPEGRKIIIWAVFHADMKILQSALGDKAVSYYGGISAKEKEANLTRFLDPADDTIILIAHPKSAGIGLNLTIANYSFWFSMNYSFNDYAQARERYNRTGQKYSMTEYVLTCEGTVDETIIRAIKDKKSVNDIITTVKVKHGK